MKQRIFALLLAVCMASSLLAVPAAAADTVRFSDVSDQDTAVAVETLRLMGVLDGYGDGSFRPSAQLNRAQFCKMAVYALNGESELGLYRTVTVFPDVKPSHWASAYINMAAKGKNVISGYPDGKFHPERTVTLGQAATILLRLLGYKDENVGGVWPDSYMAVAATIGLTDGVGDNGNAPLTRSQAAKLFLNLLRAEKQDGSKYLASLGTARDTVLASSAAGNDGKSFKTADGSEFALASGKTPSGILNGRKGTLLLNKNGKAVTFVPDAAGSNRTVTIASCTATQITDTSGVKYTLKSDTATYYNGTETTWAAVFAWLHAGNTVTLSLDSSGAVTYVFVGGGSKAEAAVIIYENGSSVGFDAITGGVTGYSIYKNGSSAGLGDLRKYDVATYSSATNSIRVCDTRVTVYYEGCEPSPREPSSITVLGGMKLTALPTAAESLSKFKPGDQMTLLLTEDGQVAGAVEASGTSARGNAVGIVRDGTVQFLCGTAKLEVQSSQAAELDGQIVRISSNQSGVTLSRLIGGTGGDLDVDAKKLGGKALAESVLIFENGKETTLDQLTSGVIPSNEILYARTNWAGKVDLIVLGSTSGDTVYYGRAIVRRDRYWKADEGHEEEEPIAGVNGHYEAYPTTIEIVYGNGGATTGAIEAGYGIDTGDYVAAAVGIRETANGPKKYISSLTKLTELKNIPNSAWSGSSAVTVGGRTYRVSADVPCYNKDTGTWMTLSEAHAYTSVSNLYVKDGTVRVVEVKHG